MLYKNLRPADELHCVGDHPRANFYAVHAARTPAALPEDSVQIRFASPNALRDEFEKNISNRGIFIATELEFEVRQAIDVEVCLDYAGDDPSIDVGHAALSLRGEVVHCIPPEMAASGATPGVAIQFDDGAAELKAAFDPLLAVSLPEGIDVPAESVEDSDATAKESVAAPGQDGRDRREAKREAVRVPVRIMPTMSPPFEATSRDLSSSGILLTVRSVELPIGEVVRTCLWHPSGESSVEIDGCVVREIKNKNGRIAAVAIAFDRSQAADPQTREVLEALRHAGHRSRLGGISGSIVDLGLANMLQMFGSSAPQGTLVVECDGEQGWIAFADSELLSAELGALQGHDALVAMLDWGEGRFRFEATADEQLVQNADRRPLDAAVFEAVCTLDERSNSTDEDEDEGSFVFGDATTFLVDADQEEVSRSSLEKTEEAVLELAKSGMSTIKLKAIIPESADSVQIALESLIELGVLIPR